MIFRKIEKRFKISRKIYPTFRTIFKRIVFHNSVKNYQKPPSYCDVFTFKSPKAFAMLNARSFSNAFYNFLY